MNSGGKHQPMKKMAHVGPNMTPMVDVVMCILIFFMLGSVFLTPELVLASSTPAGPTGPGRLDNVAVPPVRFVLTLMRRGNATWVSGSDGALFMIDRSDGGTGREGVAKYLAGKRGALSDSVQILISPRGDVPYQDVVTVFAECGHARFSQVVFAPPRGE